jgi:hypothetical protein
MKKNTYIINGIEFTTKKNILDHIRSILYSYRLGETVSGEHAAFLEDLIKKRHRWAEDKLGTGKVSFRVSNNPTYNNWCFIIRREDGTEPDFSFTECINQPRDWKKYDFMAACRRTVFEDIMGYKMYIFKKYTPYHCPITGEKLNPGNSHVDHKYPIIFERLVKAWMELRALSFDSVEIGGYEDGEVEKYFVNSSVAQDFMEFHRREATLRVISKSANLSLPRAANSFDKR